MNSNGRILHSAGAIFLLWALMTGASIAWHLVFIWVSLMIILQMILRYWSGNLSCSVELRSKGGSHEGDFEITYIFANNGLLPIPWCQVSLHLEKELGSVTFEPETMSFSISEIRSVRKNVHCPRRGVYSVGGTTVVFQDMLGVKRRLAHYEKQLTVEVFPRKYPVESVVGSGMEEGGSLRGNWPAEQDYTSISRLRQALPQEPSRHVHWKASARTEDLQVREYETRRRRGVTIILDGCIEKYSRDGDGEIEERCVEVTAGLVSSWIAKGYEVELITDNGMILILSGAETLENAMRALMVFRPNGHESMDQVVLRTRHQKCGGSVLQVVTPEMSDKEMFCLANMSDTGVSVFMVGKGLPRNFGSLRMTQIPV